MSQAGDPTYWALVVGINKYPGIGDLNGPEIDAKEFYAWVTSPRGGRVLPPGPGQWPERCKLVLSSGFVQGKIPEPTVVTIENWFEDLYKYANRQPDLKAGTRLYLYFSGHGFTPNMLETISPAVLAANATPEIPKHHVAARLWAETFLVGGYFDEMLLFMDCCRNLLDREIPLNQPGLPPRLDPAAGQRARRFYAFATKFSRLAREKPIDNVQRGLFTYALLRGLEGGAADPASGDVTSFSLESFLFNQMKKLLTREELADPDIPDEPDVYCPHNPANCFPIVSLGAAPKFRVTIQLAAEDAGQEVRISAGGVEQVILPAAAREVSLELLPGIYQMTVGARSHLFEVSGLGPQTISAAPAAAGGQHG